MEEEKNNTTETPQEARASRYELKRQKKEEERKRRKRMSLAKNVLYAGLGFLVLAGLIGGFIWFIKNRAPIVEGDIVSRTSVHWHPTFEIRINGQRQKISANIGLSGISHVGNTHTHDTSGTIHYEISAPVLKDALSVGAFFRNWGREFNSECIFESCNGEEGTLKMLVNGEENTQFDLYVIQDGDRVEIIFE